ncbi:MAG: DUF1778 domain-containing protein [Propionibacteriaceae bacterium]|jgi:uncharacterized protein (DUF1778 family)|nr:DUF1778 domain-containing protein [Propionibacteriaceae bacterium]
MSTATRDRRLSLRLTADHDGLIRTAAETLGTTVTDFTTAAAVARARETLADQIQVKLGPAAWEEFVEALDHPAPRPRLDRLMSEPSVFEA